MIESIYLTNKFINMTLLIDKEKSMYVLDEADLGVIEASHQTSKYPEQIGETNTGSALGTREISISGWVIGKTQEEIKSSKKALNTLINPLQMVDLLYEKYLLRFKPKNTIKYSVNYQENNEVLCKFLISGICFNPLFEDEESRRLVIATNNGMFRFPLTIPEDEGMVFSYRSPSLIANVVNGGTTSTGFTITFEAEGSVKNLKIINAETLEYIQINKTLEDGEKVVVCTEDGNESVTGIVGSIESNYFRYFDMHSTWMQLSVGDNILSYAAETNVDSLNVTIDYSNKYLEVQ